VSLKGRLKRLETGVRWLETDGALLAAELKLRLCDFFQQLSDHMAHDPSYREGWNQRHPGMKLPPPRVKPPPPRPAPARPPPAAKETVVEPVVAQAPPKPTAASPPPKPEPVGGFVVEPAMEIAPVFWRRPGQRDPRDG
jgi:hypothetical protein